MTARWWCRVCRAKVRVGPRGAADHMNAAHGRTSGSGTGSSISFGFTGYKPRRMLRSPAVNQPWAVSE